jgi:hypothetical protein
MFALEIVKFNEHVAVLVQDVAVFLIPNQQRFGGLEVVGGVSGSAMVLYYFARVRGATVVTCIDVMYVD